MRLNTTSQYAIRILIVIAKNCDKRYNAKMLSEELNIPYKYLTKVMTYLVKAKLIDSLRGREGGYVLMHEPDKILVANILDAVNEELDNKSCLLGVGMCTGRNKCGLHDDWQQPKTLLEQMFEQKSLHELTLQANKL